MLYSILVTVDVLLAIGIIGMVLIQQGKGADVGAAFGSGASGTVFGARGSASFLTHATAVVVTLCFVNSLVLAYLASHRPVDESVIKNMTQESARVVSDVEGERGTNQDISVSRTDEVDLLKRPEMDAALDDVPE